MLRVIGAIIFLVLAYTVLMLAGGRGSGSVDAGCIIAAGR
jgi:hypothetical protein